MSAAPAAALLAEAAAFGVRVRLDAAGKMKAGGQVPPALLARLRERKAELAGVLRGDDCWHCGRPVEHRGAGWLPFADGTAAHVACHDAAEVARVRRRAANCAAPAVLADEAELTMRGGPLP